MKIIFCGQGTILMGKIYVQEKRGGRASCQIVLSKEIDLPFISEADTILVMDEESCKDYEQVTLENIV